MCVIHDSLVIGAGQGGLASSYALKRRGIEHVVLDRDSGPGGAWQHRWDALTMDDVHGVADLPDSTAPGRSPERANVVIPEYFGEYESEHDLPVERPVKVTRVEAEDGARQGPLVLTADGGRTWRTRTLVNATGTWTRPFVPAYPGASSFAGEQFHTVTYPGPEHFRGKRVAVIGGNPWLGSGRGLRRGSGASGLALALLFEELVDIGDGVDAEHAGRTGGAALLVIAEHEPVAFAGQVGRLESAPDVGGAEFAVY